MALVDSLDAALADMLPRAGDPTSAQRAAGAWALHVDNGVKRQ